MAHNWQNEKCIFLAQGRSIDLKTFNYTKIYDFCEFFYFFENLQNRMHIQCCAIALAYRHRKACLSKQPPWHAAGASCLVRGHRFEPLHAPVGTLRTIFSTCPSFPLGEIYFILNLPHHPHGQVRVKIVKSEIKVTVHQMALGQNVPICDPLIFWNFLTMIGYALLIR